MHVQRRVATFDDDGDGWVGMIMIHRWDSARVGHERPAKPAPPHPAMDCNGVPNRPLATAMPSARGWGLWLGAEANKPVVRQERSAGSLASRTCPEQVTDRPT